MECWVMNKRMREWAGSSIHSASYQSKYLRNGEKNNKKKEQLLSLLHDSL